MQQFGGVNAARSQTSLDDGFFVRGQVSDPSPRAFVSILFAADLCSGGGGGSSSVVRSRTATPITLNRGPVLEIMNMLTMYT